MLGKDKLIYDATTPADGDSVAAFLRTSTSVLTSTIAGSLDVNVTALTASDVDIRDLVFATDKVDVTGSEVSVVGLVADDAVDSGNPIKIGSRAVSGALAAVSASGDRADLISDLYRRAWVNTSPNVAGSNAAVSIADTAGGTELFASPLAGRTKVIVQNLDNKAVYLGFGTVSVANGIRVAAGATWTDELGPDLVLKAISESVTADVRIMQVA